MLYQLSYVGLWSGLGSKTRPVGSGGFEPPKPKHLVYSQAQLSTLATAHFNRADVMKRSRRWDSNPQPAVYKTAALPIELRRQHRGIHTPGAKQKVYGNDPYWATDNTRINSLLAVLKGG